MSAFTDALLAVISPGPMLAMVGASLLGVFIGALPGLNPVMAIALLLPLTYSMDPLVALAMIAGIYNGSMYGGAIPAILLRMPGTPAAIATTKAATTRRSSIAAVWQARTGGLRKAPRSANTSQSG
jgi:putative tricarboxylic transport membrane protein